MADLLTSIRAEIDVRMRELAPAIAEYERLSTAAAALTEEGRARPRPVAGAAAPRPSAPARRAAKRSAPRGGVRRARRRESPVHGLTGQAIMAALEHGSHTLAELVMVTALRAADIREGLRHLRARGAIVKTDRDGKSAYALASADYATAGDARAGGGE